MDDVGRFLLAYAGPAVVGLVFLLTGFMKVVEPRGFVDHLQSLELVPPKHFRRLLFVSITHEVGLGVALVSGCAPYVSIPLAIATLVVLTTVTLRAARAGKIEDCGCYQGMIELTPRQSALLNIGYVVALASALPFASPFGHWISAALVVIAVVGTPFVLRESLGRLVQMRAPILDLGAVRPGRRFGAGWLPGAPVDLSEGERLVVFLGVGCPMCKPWLPVLRALNQSNQGMPVVGVLAGDASAVIAFMMEYQVELPLVVIGRGRFNRLVRGTPIAAHLVDGRIEHRYVGFLPREVALRARNTPAVDTQEAVGAVG